MIKKILIFTIILYNSILFATANHLYQINLIVFTQINSKALNSEYWPDRLYQPKLKNTIVLTTPSSTTQNTLSQAYQLLPKNKFGLPVELHRLTKNSDYQVILHQSWVQPIYNHHQAKWIHIYGGQGYDANGQSTPQHPKYQQLNGKIKISKSNFFNINTQLYLTLPENIFGTSSFNDATDNFRSIPLRSIKFFENRRTKIKELNYLDHPLVGALIQILPLNQ